MVDFSREIIGVLVRNHMCGSGSARAAVVIPPSPYVEGLAFNTSAVDSVRGSVEDIASAVVLKEAPVASRLERSAISPTADLPRDERAASAFSLTVAGGALALGVSGPPVGVVAASCDTLKAERRMTMMVTKRVIKPPPRVLR
jgi:hypothetical protein